MNKTYVGTRNVNDQLENQILVQGELGKPAVELSPARSLLVYCSSPTGFEWGYRGSGPMQLGLALLLEAGVSAEEAITLSSDFLSVVAGFQRDGFLITDDQIMEHVKRLRAKEASRG